MALLRRGSSKISEDNFRGRLEREKAKTGEISASLAWNDPSDLDIHCKVFLAAGGEADIYYSNKQAAGGCLDVDMHEHEHRLVDEPVENIFWKKPPAGVYSIAVHMYTKRGTRESTVPFRAMLKREGEDDLSIEGAVGNGSFKTSSVECFRFSVDADGAITMGTVGSPMPAIVKLSAPAAAAAKKKEAGFGRPGKAKAIKQIKDRTALAIANAKAKEKSALAKVLANHKARFAIIKSTEKANRKRALAKTKAKAKAKAAKAIAKTKAVLVKDKAKAKAKVARAKAGSAKTKAKAKAKASSVAKGKKAKMLVFRGAKLKTTKGLKKDDLIKSKGRKIVSRKKSEAGKVSKWSKATAEARKLKGYKGFKAIKKGTSFYETARELMAKM